jgi:hypothetical protein
MCDGYSCEFVLKGESGPDWVLLPDVDLAMFAAFSTVLTVVGMR